MPSQMPPLSAIVAMSVNRVIGSQNQLPWRMPADLAHFKALTTGHAILMGRKTHESIGRALPNRTNIILTRNEHYQAPNCKIATSLEQARALVPSGQTLFVIGGAEIYALCLKEVNRIHLTIVHHECDGDAYFPVLNHKEWSEVQFETHQADIDNPFEYSFITLDKLKIPATHPHDSLTENEAMIW